MRHVGFGTPHLISSVLGLDPEDPLLLALARRFVRIYAEDPTAHSVLYPGTLETLETLSSTSRLVVVSNKAAPLVRVTLESMGLASCFTHAWGGPEFGRLKPHPDGILKAMHATGIPPSLTSMVGDMPMDIRAGQAAAVRTLFVSWGFGRPPADPGPDGVLGSLPEILEWS
jgi:phosphoglycolate phosphatase